MSVVEKIQQNTSANMVGTKRKTQIVLCLMVVWVAAGVLLFNRLLSIGDPSEDARIIVANILVIWGQLILPLSSALLYIKFRKAISLLISLAYTIVAIIVLALDCIFKFSAALTSFNTIPALAFVFLHITPFLGVLIALPVRFSTSGQPFK